MTPFNNIDLKNEGIDSPDKSATQVDRRAEAEMKYTRIQIANKNELPSISKLVEFPEKSDETIVAMSCS